MNLYREAFAHIRTYPKHFWVLIAATLINQIGNMAMVFLLIYLVNYLSFSLAQASFVFAIFSAGMILSNLICGSLIHRFSAIQLLRWLLALNGLVLLCFPLANNLLIINLGAAIWGSLFGLFRPVSQTLVSEFSPKNQHKLTFSLYRLVINLGMSMGPAIGGFLALHSYAAIFIANGIANILACAILTWGFADVKGQKASETNLPLELDIKWLKYDRNLSWFLLGLIPISMVFFQHESTLAIFLDHTLHFPVSFYGLLFTLNTLMIVFFELTLNIAMSHWPYRINFLLGVFLITIGFVGLLNVARQWQVILLAILWTLGEMIFYPSATSYIAEIAPPERRGNYLSLFSMSSNLGMLFGPWGGALLMQVYGSSTIWIACGCAGILALLIFRGIEEPNRS